jgi:S-methylmethionine-dependent homocysteine/selenocysteine methylase
MSADEAEAYHRPQIETLSQTAADFINALTFTYPDERSASRARLVRRRCPSRSRSPSRSTRRISRTCSPMTTRGATGWSACGLDAGDPQELATHYPLLRERLPNFSVAVGCCGTDNRHIAAIYDALAT